MGTRNGSLDGLPELVSNGTTGFIVEKTDRHELKEKVIELLENEETRCKMGLNARRRMEKLHNKKKIGGLLKEKIQKYL